MFLPRFAGVLAGNFVRGLKGCRHYAKESKSATALKTALRSLYKKVHPDLFHDTPTAQAQNESSFKLLQDYLHQARAGDMRSAAARSPYHIIFYLKAPPQQSRQTKPQQHDPQPQTNTTTGCSAPSSPSSTTAAYTSQELHRVEVTLPPPLHRSPAAVRSTARGPSIHGMPASATASVAKLLAACGIEAKLVEGSAEAHQADFMDADSSSWSSPHPSFSSLMQFLPGALAAQREAQWGAPGVAASTRVANIRGAFRLARQLLVCFAEPQVVSLSDQVEALELLAAVLDSAPDLDLRGCSILLGDKTCIDKLGNMWLDLQDTPGWYLFLSEVDLEFVRKQKAYVQSLRSLERQVAAALGVAALYTSTSNLTQHTYRQFLERLAAHSSDVGPVEGGRFKDLPVSILPAPKIRQHSNSSPEQGDESSWDPGGKARPGANDEELFGVDESLGYIWVRDDAAAAQVYASIRSSGDKATFYHYNHRELELSAAEAQDKVLRRLRLRHLYRDDSSVDLEQFLHCCQSLLQRADELLALGAGLLEGASIRVSAHNRMAPGGTLIDVAWNFEP